jgi:hypothetical protein
MLHVGLLTQITGWLSRHDRLDPAKLAQLAAIRVRCPHLDALTGHVASFVEMMTRRADEQELECWLAAVEADDQPSYTPSPSASAPTSKRSPRPHPARQLRQCRRKRQQDDQTPDVRPRPARSMSETAVDSANLVPST